MSSRYLDFYRVKRAGDVAGLRDALPAMKLAFWQDAKAEARDRDEGYYVGLGKLALEIADAHALTGEKVAADADERAAFAASFACAGVVDAAISKMAAAGQLTRDELLKLATLNAESAFHDLLRLTRG